MEAVDLAYDVYEPEEMSSHLPPVILLHGFLWNKYLYRDLAKKLAEATKRKLFVLDLRNHGTSPCTQDSSTLLMVEDVKKFMKDMKLHRVSFVCHSFSNTIAYLIAIDMPDSVEKMLMIDNPPFNYFNQYFHENSVFPQFEIQNRLLKTLNPKMTLREAKVKFYELAQLGTKGQEHFYKKAAYDLTKENGVFKWKIDMDLLLRKYKERAFTPKGRGTSNHPILIVRCPDSGRVTDAKFEDVKKYNSNVQLLTMENTTHLLMFEETEDFVRIAMEFLSAKNDL